MVRNPRPVNSLAFLEELPALYSRNLGEGDPLLQSFLAQFEEVFDGLEAAVLGDTLNLVYKGPGEIVDEGGKNGYPLMVELFDVGRLGYPKGSLVFIPGDPDTTLLFEPIPANAEGQSMIRITDAGFLKPKRLKAGDRLVVRTGSGLTGLTSISQMPPPAYLYRGNPDKLAYLQYLASWVGLPLRADKTLSWNRRFFREAVNIAHNRSTLPGLASLLKSWHHEESLAPETVATDLIAPENEVNTVFRLGEARIGIDTVLGQGQPSHFHVHLTADPTDVRMRGPKNIEAMAAAAKLILDLEKPAHTSYNLYIHSRTMQLAPDAPIKPYKSATVIREPTVADEEELEVKDTNTFARIGVTCLIWED
jgi:hypothetical protein